MRLQENSDPAGRIIADNPLAGHDGASLAWIIVICLLAALVLFAFAGATLVDRGIRENPLPVALRGITALAASLGCSMYAWAAMLALSMEDDNKHAICLEHLGADATGPVEGFVPTYLPLGLECHVSGMRPYTAGIPGYVNGTVLICAVTTVVLGVLAWVATKRQIDEQDELDWRRREAPVKWPAP